jgi:hypothetical protein
MTVDSGNVAAKHTAAGSSSNEASDSSTRVSVAHEADKDSRAMLRRARPLPTKFIVDDHAQEEA